MGGASSTATQGAVRCGFAIIMALVYFNISINVRNAINILASALTKMAVLRKPQPMPQITRNAPPT